MDFAGYVSDIGYVHRYYRELAPIEIKLAAAMNGYASCRLEKPFTYLELGCGYADSLCIHAACYPEAQFIGIDIMPEHIAYAKELAKHSKIKNLTLIESSFADLSLDSLPLCDFIVAHGMLSWVGQDIRDQMRTIIDKKLKSKGLVYVSYNCLPGWSVKLPLWNIFRQFTLSESSSEAKIKKARELLKIFQEVGALYLKENPLLKKDIELIQGQDPHYLAHEVLHKHWQPFYFYQIYNFLTKIGLNYAGSLPLQENITQMSVPKTAVKWLSQQLEIVKHQGYKDYVVNRLFREDIYSRSKTAKSSSDVFSLDDMPLVNLKKAAKKKQKNTDLSAQIYGALTLKLEKSPCTIKQLLAAKELSDFKTSDVMQIIRYIIAIKEARPCIRQTYKNHIELNSYMIKSKRFFEKKAVLASPVLGEGFLISDTYSIIAQALTQAHYDEKKALDALIAGKKPAQKTIKNVKLLIKQVNESVLPLLAKVGVNF